MITEMEHSLYSHDLVPNDLWLFPKIVCLNGTYISGYRRHPEKKYEDGIENYSAAGIRKMLG
jgi:hypothetical protein